MKKKLLIFGVAFFTVAIVILLIFILKKPKYTIVVSKVDDQSPDRMLTVYNEDNKKIEAKKIMYMDGTFLCYGYNPAVHFSDIENEKELKVLLKDKTEAIAKVVNEEVKK